MALSHFIDCWCEGTCMALSHFSDCWCEGTNCDLRHLQQVRFKELACMVSLSGSGILFIPDEAGIVSAGSFLGATYFGPVVLLWSVLLGSVDTDLKWLCRMSVMTFLSLSTHVYNISKVSQLFSAQH